MSSNVDPSEDPTKGGGQGNVDPSEGSRVNNPAEGTEPEREGPGHHGGHGEGRGSRQGDEPTQSKASPPNPVQHSE